MKRARAPSATDPTRITALLFGLILLAAAGFVVILMRPAFLGFGGSDAGATVTAQVIVFFGVVLTGLVAMVGHILKHIVEQRTAALREIEGQRTAAQREQDQKRLEMDTAIRSIGLLKDGASPTQRLGTLFVLINLQQVEYALHLLQDLWSEDEIASSSAVWVVDQGLQSPSERLQTLAAAILSRNADSLALDTGGIALPPSLADGWSLAIAPRARYSLLDAIVRALLSRPLPEWKRQHLLEILLLVNDIRERDLDQWIHAAAVLYTDVLLRLVPRGTHCFDGSSSVEFHDVREKVKAQLPAARNNIADSDHAFARRLRKWSEQPTARAPMVRPAEALSA